MIIVALLSNHGRLNHRLHSCFELPGRLAQISFANDIVAIKNRSRLMAADGHGDTFRNPATNHVANRSPAKVVEVGIPVKMNADSAGKPNGIPLEGEQQSERSDAGVLIVR